MPEACRRSAQSDCSGVQAIQPAYYPPAPEPQVRPLGPVGLIRALKRNPLECFTLQHFQSPIVEGACS
jgi:hypothetical protein